MSQNRRRTRLYAALGLAAAAVAGVGVWAGTAQSSGNAHSSARVMPAVPTPSKSAQRGDRKTAPQAVPKGPATRQSATAAGEAATRKDSAETMTPAIRGTFTLWVASPQADPCVAQPAAPDIHPGADVVLRSTKGGVLARTILTAGHTDATHRGCVYGFAVTPLHAGSPFTVTVGARGGLTYTAADVAAAKGRIALNLGLAA